MKQSIHNTIVELALCFLTLASLRTMPVWVYIVGLIGIFFINLLFPIVGIVEIITRSKKSHEEENN